MENDAAILLNGATGSNTHNIGQDIDTIDLNSRPLADAYPFLHILAKSSMSRVQRNLDHKEQTKEAPNRGTRWKEAPHLHRELGPHGQQASQ
eukprot:11542863-Heterocapsa_arctica.AAC.1